MSESTNSTEKKVKKVYLDLNNYNDDFTLKVIPYINQLLNSIDPEEFKEMYPDNEVKRLDACVKEFMELVYNNPGPLSTKLIENQINFCDNISEILTRKVCDGPTESDLFFKDHIEDFDSFFLPIQICLNIFNATRFVVRDLDDIYTVSTIVILNILGSLDIQDKDLRYKIIKIVGRKNEYDYNYTGIKEVELDYDLYYQRNIVDSTLLILNTDIIMLIEAFVVATIMNEEFSGIIEELKSDDFDEEMARDYIRNTAIFIGDKVLDFSEEILEALEYKKYKMTPLCVETLNLCLSRFEPLKIVYDDTFKSYELEYDLNKIIDESEKIIFDYMKLMGINL